MSRGGIERKTGRRRHTNRVSVFAGELITRRAVLDGMEGGDPEFEHVLADAETAATELAAVSMRMDRGGLSRRAACESIIARTALAHAEGALQ